MRALKPVDITFYLDMFFLVNLFMDLLLLDLMKHFLRLSGRRIRVVAAAAAGSVGACAVLPVQVWLELYFFPNRYPGLAGAGIVVAWMMASSVGIPALLLLAAFGRCPWQEFVKRMVVFWVSSACMGGILSLAEGPGMSGWYLSGTLAVRRWKLLPLFFWAAGMYFAVQTLEQRITLWRQERELFCRVTLFYRGRCQTVTALWDTGNHLYEPYGHQPVHVITDEACRRLCDTVSQMAYIPFRSVGTGYGLLPGIRIDGMDVVRCGKPARHYDRPWLAISKGPLSAGRRYEMLLHGEERE